MEMDQLVALCKRRGFLFQSSEIYGGLQGFWDYGPMGVELKRNVREAWWRDMVTGHNELLVPPGAPATYEMVGLDCAIIMHPQVWKVSGHYDLFHDFMQTCRQCKKLVRADHVGEMLRESEWVASLGTRSSTWSNRTSSRRGRRGVHEMGENERSESGAGPGPRAKPGSHAVWARRTCRE